MKNAVSKHFADASKYYISHPQGLEGQRISDVSVPPKRRGIPFRDAVHTLTGAGLGGKEETPQNYKHAGSLRRSLKRQMKAVASSGQVGARLKQLSKMGFAQEKRGKDLREAAFSHSRSLPWPSKAGVTLGGVTRSKSTQKMRKRGKYFGDVEAIHSGKKETEQKMLMRRLRREPHAHFTNPYHNKNPYATERRVKSDDKYSGFVEKLAKSLAGRIDHML